MTAPGNHNEIAVTTTAEAIPVTRDEIERAAGAARTVSDDRVAVQIGSHLVDVREVVAGAIQRPASDVTVREALRVLDALGFPVVGAPPQLTSRSHDARLEHSDAESVRQRSTESGQKPVAPLLDLEQSRLLRRYEGRWVALRGTGVVADGASLRELMDLVHPDPADPVTVLYVPSSSGPA
jgi:hypothetical protein